MKTAHLLVIEDDAEYADFLKETLAQHFMSVTVCYCGSEVFSKIESVTPDVILSDYKMPGLDGLELARFLRDRRIWTPLVWLTGWGSKEVVRDAWRAGVFEVLEKPTPTATLLETLQRALEYGREGLKAPRPQITLKDSFVKLQLSLPREVYDELEKESITEGMAPSSLAKTILRDYFASSKARKAG